MLRCARSAFPSAAGCCCSSWKMLLSFFACFALFHSIWHCFNLIAKIRKDFSTPKERENLKLFCGIFASLSLELKTNLQISVKLWPKVHNEHRRHRGQQQVNLGNKLKTTTTATAERQLTENKSG